MNENNLLNKQNVSMFLRFNLFNDVEIDENSELFDFYLAM